MYSVQQIKLYYRNIVYSSVSQSGGRDPTVGRGTFLGGSPNWVIDVRTNVSRALLLLLLLVVVHLNTLTL